MSGGQIKIELLQDSCVPLWDEYVRRNERASLYHLTFWRDIVHKVFKHKSAYVCARSATGGVVGVLPLISLQSLLFGNFAVSMPYFNYGGAIGDTPEIEEALMAFASAYAGNAGMSHCEFRDVSPRGEAWPVRTDKVVMELMLPNDESALWDKLKSKLRAQVKRPIKEGAQAVVGRRELLEDFYAVFARNMRDLGTPVYSKDFFDAILARYEEASYIVVVRKDNQPVAAALLLGFRGRLEIPWASSIREYNPLGVNMLLYWESLRLAIRYGYSVFDFGRSTQDGGTYRFKMQWGAVPRQLYWHYWLGRDQGMPKMNPDNPKYKLAIRIWQRLPLFITKLIGPVIVKNLP